MTSARRAARAAARAAPVASGSGAPPELLDADHAVWHDQHAYHRYMAAQDWTLLPAERLGCTTSPANRRRAAAAQWAVRSGTATRTYGTDKHPHPDWHRLRELGLCD